MWGRYPAPVKKSSDTKDTKDTKDTRKIKNINLTAKPVLSLSKGRQRAFKFNGAVANGSPRERNRSDVAHWIRSKNPAKFSDRKQTL